MREPRATTTTDAADDDMGGAARDLPVILGRRHLLLAAVGGGAAALLTACSSGSTTGATTGPTTASDGAGATSPTNGTDGAACAQIAPETAGPFPGDGSNGPDVLAEDGVVRRDIRTSVGTASGTADGVPLTVRLRIVDLAGGCAALPGAAVYLWHCDRNGDYSMYSSAVVGENYLRGVQAADEDGVLEFVTVFPGAYPGRWPHMHFEVYPDVASAIRASGQLATSQLALPADWCTSVYASPGYEASADHLASMSIETDGAFRDGVATQLAAVTGEIGGELVADLTISV